MEKQNNILYNYFGDSMISRIEKDEYGEMELPLNAYYGIKTLRNKEMFSVSKFKIHKQFIKSLAIIKKACALSNYDAKNISLEKAKAIAETCDEIINGRFKDQFITDAIQGGSGSAFNTNMNEVIANRATEKLGGKLGAYDLVNPVNDVNLFQTTNDAIPTAAKHAIIVLTKALQVEIKKLIKSFKDKQKQYKNTLKMSHNHLQDSLPITFGMIFESMASTFERDCDRLQNAINELYYINLGSGSIGVTYYSEDDYVKNILKRINEFTGMDFKFASNMIDDSRNIDEFVSVSNALKLLALNLSKTASDIRLMASGPIGGFNEIIIPKYDNLGALDDDQSSQKVPEIVNEICYQVIGKDLTIMLAAEHGELETNSFTSIVFPNIFDSLEYLTRVIKIFREYCVEQIEVNEEACKQSILNSSGIIVTLLGKINYQTCVDLVVESGRRKISIKQLCLEKKLFTEDELNSLMTTKNIKFK